MTSITSRVSMATCSMAALLCLAGTGFQSHQAQAQMVRPAIANLAPGQSVVTTGQPATIISTVRYQAILSLQCTTLSCDGVFPKAGAKRQINYSRVSCSIVGNSGSTFRTGWAGTLVNGSFVAAQYLPIQFSSSDGYHTLNHAIDLQIAGKSQALLVQLFLDYGTASAADCTVTGTLSVLE